MRLRIPVSLTLVAALFVAAACRGDKIEPEKEPRLVSVSVTESTVVMPDEGRVEVTFRV